MFLMFSLNTCHHVHDFSFLSLFFLSLLHRNRSSTFLTPELFESLTEIWDVDFKVRLQLWVSKTVLIVSQKYHHHYKRPHKSTVKPQKNNMLPITAQLASKWFDDWWVIQRLLTQRWGLIPLTFNRALLWLNLNRLSNWEQTHLLPLN